MIVVKDFEMVKSLDYPGESDRITQSLKVEDASQLWSEEQAREVRSETFDVSGFKDGGGSP